MVETTNSCPANSSNVFGLRLEAVTSYAGAVGFVMELVYRETAENASSELGNTGL